MYTKNPLITCDVYSNTQVYGDEFHKTHDDEFKPLYDQAKREAFIQYSKNIPIHNRLNSNELNFFCLLYTSDAADE